MAEGPMTMISPIDYQWSVICLGHPSRPTTNQYRQGPGFVPGFLPHCVPFSSIQGLWSTQLDLPRQSGHWGTYLEIALATGSRLTTTSGNWIHLYPRVKDNHLTPFCISNLIMIPIAGWGHQWGTVRIIYVNHICVWSARKPSRTVGYFVAVPRAISRNLNIPASWQVVGDLSPEAS